MIILLSVLWSLNWFMVYGSWPPDIFCKKKKCLRYVWKKHYCSAKQEENVSKATERSKINENTSDTFKIRYKLKNSSQNNPSNNAQ